MFSEKEYIKAIGIISCYLNCDEMSTEEFNDSIVVINDLINEYFEIIEEKERLEKALDKACEELEELDKCHSYEINKQIVEKKGSSTITFGYQNKEEWKEWCMK